MSEERRKKIADAMQAREDGAPSHIEQLRRMLELEQLRKAQQVLGAQPRGIMPPGMGGSPTTPMPVFEGEPRGAVPIGPQVGEPAKPVPLSRKMQSRARLYELMR